jgi:2-polyprenyl-6-methoxyphenol hydroxylase-like FAD-dependent oxidoreductase
MKRYTSLLDAAVVGAGPIGCVAALSLAERGARVLLLEASSELPRRLAGEWLHPPAAEILSRWDVRLPDTAASTDARGFVVFPADGSSPIELPYDPGIPGITCEHGALVAALRQRAQQDPRIRLESGARVCSIAGQRVTYASRGGPEISVHADLVVGADGRSSVVRKQLGISDGRIPISSMAGVLLEDVTLPFEGFGHVVLGGPGPALLYAIGPGRARACFDLPSSFSRCPDRTARLWQSYADVLPRSVRGALRRALADRPIAWATNLLRPRTEFGREGAALAGDAVGHFHPLTAVGLTLGFQDAVCLAASPSVAAYGRERSAQSRVAEVLATALYQALTLQDEEIGAVRAAIYDLWRGDADERQRTMRLLSAQETEPAEFLRVFRMVLTRALRDTVANRRWTRTPGILRTLSGSLEWPWVGELSRSLRAPLNLLTPFRRYSRP